MASQRYNHLLRGLAFILAAAMFLIGISLQTYLITRGADAHVCDQARRQTWVDATVTWATALGGAVEDVHGKHISRQQYYERVHGAYVVYLPILKAYREKKCP